MKRGQKIQNFRRAFTLLELLISMAVMSVVMLIMGQLLMTSFRVNYKLNARQQLLTDIDVTNRILTYNIQSSKSTGVSDMCPSANTLKLERNDSDSNMFSIYLNQDPINNLIFKNDTTGAETVLNSDETQIMSFDVECTEDTFGNVQVIATVKAQPRYGLYKDEVFVVRQIVITTETFEVGYE
ncbi:MAG TPA: type II secretion system protein [Candidatus Dojkabacteria bacterium]|nr:type II secretion system protein [Candidatus Dojkabacteria bacterium]HQF36700.1 type II secretion system protein [Candidatus Dojkabacteria bacterium]